MGELLHPPRGPPTPEPVRKFRRAHYADPGAKTYHWGVADDPNDKPNQVHGTKFGTKSLVNMFQSIHIFSFVFILFICERYTSKITSCNILFVAMGLQVAFRIVITRISIILYRLITTWSMTVHEDRIFSNDLCESFMASQLLLAPSQSQQLRGSLEDQFHGLHHAVLTSTPPLPLVRAVT